MKNYLKLHFGELRNTQDFIKSSLLAIIFLLYISEFKGNDLFSFIIIENLSTINEILILTILSAITIVLFINKILNLNWYYFYFLSIVILVETTRFKEYEILQIRGISLAYFPFILTVLLFIKSIKYYFQKKSKGEKELSNGLIAEKEINEFDSDIIGLEDYIKKLKNEIIQYNHNISCTIGIEGSYGSGKTSLVRLLFKELEKEKNIKTLEFNSWQYDNFEKLVQDYFNSVMSFVRFDKKHLEEYKNIISAVSKSFLGMNLIPNSNSEENNVNKTKEKINSVINAYKYDTKYVVLIDNIDRLENDEIINVFKLIRNLVDFNNFIFLVPFDNSILEGKVEKIKKHYFDKVFTSIIEVPKIDKSTTGNLFISLIEKRISEFKFDTIDHKTQVKNDLDLVKNNSIVYESFENIREAKRFYNYFIQNYTPLINVVSFHDYLYLSLLKFQFPKIYNEINENRKTNELAFNIEEQKKNHENALEDKILDRFYIEGNYNNKSIHNKYRMPIYFSEETFFILNLEKDFDRIINLEELEIVNYLNIWISNIRDFKRIKSTIQNSSSLKDVTLLSKILNAFRIAFIGIDHSKLNAENINQIRVSLTSHLNTSNYNKVHLNLIEREIESENDPIIDINFDFLNRLIPQKIKGLDIQTLQINLFEKLISLDKEISKILVFKYLYSLNPFRSNLIEELYMKFWESSFAKMEKDDLYGYFLHAVKNPSHKKHDVFQIFASDLINILDMFFYSEKKIKEFNIADKNYYLKLYTFTKEEELISMDKIIKARKENL